MSSTETEIISDKEKIEVCKELDEGFKSFFYFSLDLIEKLDEENNNLKFSVVNIQIALELFLKYFFLMKNKPERVFISKNNQRKFRDFSDVLKSYYSIYKQETYANKKYLIEILESRNNIVHKGKYKKWDENLAEYIINCVFFIQGNYKDLTNQTLLKLEFDPHKLSDNLTWKRGSSEFAKKISKKHNQIPLECPYCLSRSLIQKRIFEFDDEGEVENYQCLTCLCEIDNEIQGALIECCQCKKKGFYLDKLNVQTDKTYFGGCLNCGTNMDVKKCANCETFYFYGIQKNEIEFNNDFFCCDLCLETFKNKNFG